MEYLQHDSVLVANQLSLKSLNNKLQNSKVQSLMTAKGYNFYWFEGGYLPSKSYYNKNEIFIPATRAGFSSKHSSDNDFLMFFIDNSLMSPFSERIKFLYIEIFRKKVNNIFNKLPELANSKDCKFVFAHIMAPHPPYVFGENGESVYYEDKGKNRKQAFINQLKYINKRTADVIEDLVHINNGRNKIIVLQGDHGTRENLPNDIYSFSQNWTQETFGNLSAVYFSDKSKMNNINYYSSTNTFRVIFNKQFNQDIELLEDIKYYTDFTFPLKFQTIKQTQLFNSDKE